MINHKKNLAKILLIICITICMFLLFLGVLSVNSNLIPKDTAKALSPFSGGSGTELDPYQISTTTDFEILMTKTNSLELDPNNSFKPFSALCYILTNDIDFEEITYTSSIGSMTLHDIYVDETAMVTALSSYYQYIYENFYEDRNGTPATSTYDSTKTYYLKYQIPSAFYGIFNGNGHTISNITINKSGDYSGIFGASIYAKIYNLVIYNATISGTSIVGGLIGNSFASDIDNIVVANSSISATSGSLGGVIGATNSTNTNYAVLVESNDTNQISNDNTTMDFANCVTNVRTSNIDKLTSFRNTISTTSGYSGGVIGSATEDVNNIYNSSSLTNVAGVSYAGGLIGYSTSSINTGLGISVGTDFTPTIASHTNPTKISMVCFLDSIVNNSYLGLDISLASLLNWSSTGWTVPTNSGTTYYYPCINSSFKDSYTAYAVYVDSNLFSFNATGDFSNLPAGGFINGYEFAGYSDGNDLYIPNESYTANTNLYLISTYTLISPTFNIATTNCVYNYGVDLFPLELTASSLVNVTYEFTWYYSQTENGVFTSIQLDTDSTPSTESISKLVVQDLLDNGYYYCVVTITDTGSLTATSTSDTYYVDISRADVSITINNNSNSITYSAATYTASDLASYTINTVLTQQQEEAFSVTLLFVNGNSTISNVGEYEISCELDNSNINLSVTNSTFYITNASITLNNIADISTTYNGDSYGLINGNFDITTINNQVSTISYSSNGTNFSSSSPTFITVGTHTIYYIITAPNHDNLEGSYSFTISKNAITLSKTSNSLDISKVYDGTNVYVEYNDIDAYSVNYSTPYNGISPIVKTWATFGQTNITNSTSITLGFGLSDTTNFELVNSSLEYTGASILVASISITPSVSYAEPTKTYDGSTYYNPSLIDSSLYTVSVTNSVVSAPAVYINSATFNSCNVADADSIVLVFTITNSNFILANNSISLDASITPVELTISNFTCENKLYDSTTNATYTYDLTGMVNNETVYIIGAYLNSANVGVTTLNISNISTSYDNINPTDNYYFHEYTDSIECTISQATPTVVPSIGEYELFITSDSLPTISIASSSTPGSISWNSGWSITGTGTFDFYWTFTPTSDNYTSVVNSMELTVIEDYTTGIDIISNPSTLTYNALTTFDLTGLVVHLLYKSGEYEVISNNSLNVKYDVDNSRAYFVYGDTSITISYLTYEENIFVNINKNLLIKPTLINSSFVYSGTGITPTMYNYQSNYMNSTILEQTNVGEYNFIISLKDSDNFSWTDSTITPIELNWNITKRVYNNISIPITSYTFTGSNIYPVISNGTNLTSSFYSLTGDTSATNAGTYEITATVNDIDNTCWSSNGSTLVLSWSIVPQHITKPILYNTPITYTGSDITPTIQTSTAYTLSGDTTCKNVGDYEIIATLNNNELDAFENVIINYIWSDETTTPVNYEYSVVPMRVTLPIVYKTDFTYTGLSIKLDLKQSNYYVITGNSYATNAGEYNATLSLLDTNNYVWNNDTTSDYVISWRINKIVVNIPTNAINQEFNGNEITASIPTSNYYELLQNTATSAGEYTAVARLIDKTNYCWSDNSNANKSIQWKILIRKIEKITQPGNLLYNGLSQTLALPASSYYSITGNVGTNIGSYSLVVSLNDKVNTSWEDGSTTDLEYTWNIYSISTNSDDSTNVLTTYNLGDTLPTLYKNGFTFAGWYLTADYSGEPITSLSEINANTTLYAKWTEKPNRGQESTSTPTLGTYAIVGIAIGGVGFLIGIVMVILGISRRRINKGGGPPSDSII